MSDGLKLVRSIIEQSATSELRNLTSDFFVGSDELEVYEFVRTHYRRYTEMPTHTTVEEETGIPLPNVEETCQYYFDRCYDRRMFNAVREPFNGLRTALMENSADDARELISDMNANVRRYDAAQDLLTLSDLSTEVMEAYDYNHRSSGISGITTGWPSLDEQTDGYQNGDFIVWVARPEVGKTHLLINGARRAWMSGKKVLFVSMEMTLKQIANRFYAHHASVDPDLFRKGRLSQVAYDRVQDVVRELEGDRRFHLFAGNFKGKRTDELDALIQEVAPDVIYIDGFYIMQPSTAPSRVDRISKVGYLADEIKQIALQRERPIICTSQFSREAGKGGKTGGLESIGFSDAIGQHASVAISIKMPPNNRDPRPAHRIIETMKGREGEYTRFAINFKFAPVDFSEADHETSTRLLATRERGSTGPRETESESTDFML